MPENALPCRNIAIRIDKPTDFGVIVAGIEPIPAGFGIVEVASITQGVKICYVIRVRAYVVAVAVGYRGNNAPLVVGVASDKCACLVGYAYYIILRVAEVFIFFYFSISQA